MSELRLSKLIAQRGVASRREAEQMIREGRLTVNGETVSHPGTVVDVEADHVRLDGNKLPERPHLVYYLLYKPRGYITTRNDPQGRKSVMELLANIPTRVEPVGRLDLDTEGVLLFTNDGDLANKLTHPSNQIPKRYIAKVWKSPSERTLARIQSGVFLDDGKTAPCKARIIDKTDGGNARVEITVTEGKNRLIRRLLDAVGHPVSKLRRESFATLTVRDMERGQVRKLNTEEVRRLHDIAAGRNPKRAGKIKSRKGFAKAKPKNQRRTGKPLARKTKRR